MAKVENGRVIIFFHSSCFQMWGTRFKMTRVDINLGNKVRSDGRHLINLIPVTLNFLTQHSFSTIILTLVTSKLVTFYFEPCFF